MILKSLSLQHFRSYPKASFDFDEGTTLIVGVNTAGKSNLIEAIYLLATGKSFRADKDIEMVQFEKDNTRVKGEGESGKTLEVVLLDSGQSLLTKRYLVNNISRRRVDFAGNLTAVLFSPLDLELLSGSPSRRRRFLDDVLEQVDREYRIALTSYEKALRQRNALLDRVKGEGLRVKREDFVYWDNLLIENGQRITEKREALIAYFNDSEKIIFPCEVIYDKSTISSERLLQYRDAELGTGVTLVGPHRDDFAVRMHPNKKSSESELKDVKLFGSRGQQRLAVLQLKLLVLAAIEEKKGERPILLLDDIFSELDQGHIDHVVSLLGQQQTILTTTHKDFLPPALASKVSMVELDSSV